jgi:hypothetical protein
MTDLVVGLNMEALVADWLSEHPALAELGVRVAGEIPRSTTGPWIRVTLLSASDHPRIGRDILLEHVLQLECYAGSTAAAAKLAQREAWQVKARARAILKAIEGTARDGVSVPEVRFDGDARIPDTVLEPARERYILTVAIRARALPV